ncbi:MAG: ferredoxin family protein [Acidobacteria bacterium]|nr:ferredoxin family protein [Acidobacteriota bacterium]
MTSVDVAATRVVIEATRGEGTDRQRRFDVMRALLEKGYAVSASRTVPAADDDRVRVLRHADYANGPSALLATLDRAREQGGRPQGGAWKPWFPVIDYQRCTNCMQCLSFCLFDVYGVSADKTIEVRNQSNCKTDCPACSRVCPEVAIMFPKYRHGPINGEEVHADDIRREAMRVDISALLGGDIYAALRDRSAKATSRFSKERDDARALKERQTCLVALQKALDVPAEVLASLPTSDEIRARAAAAMARAREATGE